MSAFIRHNKDRDVYELGGTIDGEFVTFAEVGGEEGRARAADLKAHRERSEGSAGGAQSAGGGDLESSRAGGEESVPAQPAA